LLHLSCGFFDLLLSLQRRFCSLHL
jgi:hypothetical protein